MNRPSSYLKGAWKVRMALLDVFHSSAWSVEIVGKSANKSFVSLHSPPSSRPICYSPAFATAPQLSLCGNRTQNSQISGAGLAIAVERGSSGVGLGGLSSVGAAFGRKRVGVMPASTIAVGGQEVMEEEKMDPVQHRLMFDDECILVDEKDNVVGHDSKYNCHLMEKIEKENLLHRAFSVFLFNSKNELLLQKRSATKVTFPMVWTNTCCSHPLYRDSELIKENNLGVRNAAQRKLFDELGIEAPDAPVDDFTCLGRILYKAASDGKWGEHELDYLVFMKRDVTVKPNPEEVSDVMYVTKEQLQELVQTAKAGKDGVKLSPWFQLVVENFLYDWWKRLEQGTLAEVADMKTIHKLV